ncbi:MAG: HDOD domain-containing protein, partial [Planctomycetota bacterium]
MAKARCELSATEIEQLHRALGEKLDRVGIETQPEVAMKILDLVNDAQAQLVDYAKIIKTDAALSGRLLRLANSAFFAQVTPVSTLERACSLLGIDRLRAFSLGFYLSRAASSDVAHRLSRRVWGESVFRACLAACLARRLVPHATMEAFIVGLMMDAGLPLMYKLQGRPFLEIDEERATPSRRHHREFTSLAYTHVDVIAVLAKTWKLPSMLAKPLVWHHSPPGDCTRQEPEHILHRIAYYVGALELDDRTKLPREAAPMSALATRMIGCDDRDLTKLIAAAAGEYKATMAVFSGVAASMESIDSLPDLVHLQLARILDETLTRETVINPKPTPSVFRL